MASGGLFSQAPIFLREAANWGFGPFRRCSLCAINLFNLPFTEPNAMRLLLSLALLVSLSFGLSHGQAFAQSKSNAVSPSVRQAINQSVEQWLGGRFKVTAIGTTPIAGIYEVQIGQDLFYIDEKASFAIVEGQMIELKSGKNLTAARLEEVNRIDFKTLPLELAMKTVTGDGGKGKRNIAVFEDPYCSYCRRFRATLMDLDNVTIYTFFYPILRPESVTVSRNAWCAKDRQQAWDDWMLSGKEPAAAKEPCNYPQNKIVELGKLLNVQATPTSFVSSGKRLQGALGKEAVEASFKP
jgi:thiol:disulfide interchange protein DsbC